MDGDDKLVREYEVKIWDVIQKIDVLFFTKRNKFEFVKQFISVCSISDFEKLKEMDYDLSTNKITPDDTAQ